MRSPRSVFALSVLLSWFVLGEGAQAQGGPGQAPPPVTVAKPVVKDIIERTDFIGRFEAVDQVDIRARVSGYLDKVHFQDGTFVKAGDLLFTIDPRPYRNTLEQAQATVTSAQVRLEFAQSDLDRAEQLRRTGNIADQLFDQRRQAFLTGKAEMDRAQAALRQAQLDVEFTEIKAPLSGRISRKLVSEGNLVNANETILTNIVSLDPIQFYFDVDERSFLAFSRQAQGGTRTSTNGETNEVTLTLTDERLGELQGRGRLRRQPPRCGERHDPRSRDLRRTRICFLTPGLFGRVTVGASDPYKGILLPDEAIGSDQDRRVVYVVGREERRPSQARAHRTADRRLSRHPRRADRQRDGRRERARPRPARNADHAADDDASTDARAQRQLIPREEIAMRFAHFFVDRPIFATVLSALFLIIGGIAYTTLPVAQYPEIAPPTVVVRASYPGADAQTVAATVATPLEQQINGVEDMLYMSSYSTGDGAMALTITFKLGTDLDNAQVLVQNRVAIATPRLPEEVRRLGVTTLKSSPDLMMVVHMLSPDDSYDQLYVSNYARNNVRDILLRLDGVGDLIIFGERQYSLRIWLDPEKLASFGMTSSDVVRAIQEQNVQVSGGALGQEPTPSDTAFQLTVTTQGRFEDPRQFRQIIVQATPRGTPRPAAGRRAHRARRPGLRDEFLSERQAGRCARDLPAAGHQCARRSGSDHPDHGAAQGRASRPGSTTRSSTTRRSSSPRA